MLNIIVVDDETMSLQLFLSEVINEHGIDYHFFHDSPNEIRKFVVQNNIDAAFLDINMPNINGIELAKELIGLNHNIKIVFITGLSVAEGDLPNEIRGNVIGFLYKPFETSTLMSYLSVISAKRKVLSVTMFGSFTCMLGKSPLRFSSTKSEELFALLLVYNGQILNMNDAICHLWPDKDLDKAKILYRDAVWRLRKTLNDNNLECVDFQKSRLILNKTNINCDYWDYLNGLNDDFVGDFLNSYDWSDVYLNRLDEIYYKRHPEN